MDREFQVDADLAAGPADRLQVDVGDLAGTELGQVSEGRDLDPFVGAEGVQLGLFLGLGTFDEVAEVLGATQVDLIRADQGEPAFGEQPEQCRVQNRRAELPAAPPRRRRGRSTGGRSAPSRAAPRRP
ncbi:hypothetical protein Q0Z83_051930 [Actinoplanes sichuanensis]|nr:hypothetical protein Q0Z83_051930 [Actinoplanes sichuanensis]